jgi:hypothetical protein
VLVEIPLAKIRRFFRKSPVLNPRTGLFCTKNRLDSVFYGTLRSYASVG